MWPIVGMVGIVMFMVFGSIYVGQATGNSVCERSIDWHRVNGTHRVIYPDLKVSQPFSCKVAHDYQKIFGGRVVTKDHRLT